MSWQLLPGEGIRAATAARSLDPTKISRGETATIAPPKLVRGACRRRPAGDTILRDLASLKLTQSLILTRILNEIPSLPARLDGFPLYSEAF